MVKLVYSKIISTYDFAFILLVYLGGKKTSLQSKRVQDVQAGTLYSLCLQLLSLYVLLFAVFVSHLFFITCSCFCYFLLFAVGRRLEQITCIHEFQIIIKNFHVSFFKQLKYNINPKMQINSINFRFHSVLVQRLEYIVWKGKRRISHA